MGDVADLQLHSELPKLVGLGPRELLDFDTLQLELGPSEKQVFLYLMCVSQLFLCLFFEVFSCPRV